MEKNDAYQMDVRAAVTHAATSGLFLAVTLSWTRAVQSGLDLLLPSDSSLASEFLAALLMTVGVTIVVGVGVKLGACKGRSDTEKREPKQTP
jgi:hypothetical protein